MEYLQMLSTYCEDVKEIVLSLISCYLFLSILREIVRKPGFFFEVLSLIIGIAS